ncbi:cyclic AMP-responsive element-binding protein 1-like [Thalassophryne amazonica]|uniref:cyclic AMP-responsive element-binding protein 1-like n=1 Tax=Thalassophryne amazonica TaxID=390379 RepID=UPI0014722E94|nr:cyclic AMP-responsive element-binding protein 1-like [Thalassophryne amazonica]
MRSQDNSAATIASVDMQAVIDHTNGQYSAIIQGGAIQLATNATDDMKGQGTLTMSNAATILHHDQTRDVQQTLLQSSQVVSQGQ